jgi:formate dehydrogenase major subunit
MGWLDRYIGRVPTPVTRETREKRSRIRDARVTVSVCPYCAVGCSELVYARDGQIIHIEGNYESPINAGTLCPKGAAHFGLLNSPQRITRVKYRPPYGDHWEERPLEWAMERIAHLVKATRDATYEVGDDQGNVVNRTTAIGHFGGATPCCLITSCY